MALTKWNGILYGGDYCPEQWDEETLHEDIRIMKEYGINAVTLNVHSWCVYQPEEGAYSFGVMDHPFTGRKRNKYRNGYRNSSSTQLVT